VTLLKLTGDMASENIRNKILLQGQILPTTFLTDVGEKMKRKNSNRSKNYLKSIVSSEILQIAPHLFPTLFSWNKECQHFWKNLTVTAELRNTYKICMQK
jgi:hypothetical protein